MANETTKPEAMVSEEDYLAKAEKFLSDAAKMNNAPVPFMVAAAFKNEDRAKRAESALAAAKRDSFRKGMEMAASLLENSDDGMPTLPRVKYWIAAIRAKANEVGQ